MMETNDTSPGNIQDFITATVGLSFMFLHNVKIAHTYPVDREMLFSYGEGINL
jgi:hypothetical protein